MKLLRALTGGLAGSVILTSLHQLLQKNYKNAPRMDLLGEEAIAKGFNKVGADRPSENKLHKMALAGDIVANTLFFGAAATTISSCSKGTLLGIAAGLGGIYLPEKLGLNPEHSNRTLQTKVLTVGLYALGGYVAGKVIDRLS
jgi:hypothetical protein